VFGLWSLAALLLAASTARGEIELNVTRVGFPTVRTGDVVRSGSWAPILVDLALVGQAAFDGRIQVAQFDTDGDQAHDSVEVHLRADTGGTQRIMLYVPANPNRDDGKLYIELLTTEGEAQQVVSQGVLTYRATAAGQAEDIHDDILILDVSSATLGRVRDLVDPQRSLVFRRPVRVAHISPTELPELWIGLEAVDYIVWDDARPEELTQRQREALVTWARLGGTLLIAASRTASALKLSPELDAILPASIGEVTEVDNLPVVRRRLVGQPLDEEDRLSRRTAVADWFMEPFTHPVPVVHATRRARAVALPGDEGTSVGSDVVTRWIVDRGVVVFSAVVLKDLFSGSGEPAGFFQNVLELETAENDEDTQASPQPLFPNIVSAIAFSTSATVYLLAAFAFSVAYLAVATGGVWWFLGRRGLRHHSWSAFALVAGAASILSVMAVNAIRGFGETLHQVGVIDLTAGDNFGSATAYFGVKSGTDKELDLWLPSDPVRETEPTATRCFVRALPAAGDLMRASPGAGFADPESYQVVPASAVIADVRLRATLKRFESRWEGPLRGTVDGEVSIARRRITDDSFVVNSLDVPLRDCWLLHAMADPGEVKGTRSNQIFAFPLGDLPARSNRIPLADRCYRPQGRETLSQFLLRSTLDKAQQEWHAPFGNVWQSVRSTFSGSQAAALGEEEKALLLASTLGDLDPRATPFGTVTWSRERVRQLDLRHLLREDSVVLIGFADDAGPVRLFRRTGDREYRPIEPEPEKSWTMYRVRIPAVVRDDRPPPEPDNE
jgi:hypothetical protein